MNLNEDLITKINAQARRSPNYTQSKHCAAIFSRNGNLICMSHNRHSKHAEMRVLQKYFSNPSFYGKGIGYMMVVRVNKTGKWIYSKSCIKCQKLLKDYNIKVVYSK